MLSPEQHEELLNTLKNLVKSELKKDAKLWTLTDVAEYIDVSLSTVSKYRKQPGFPEPVYIPYEKKEGEMTATMRFYPKEIKSWVLRLRAA